jgi:hypothetical protein
MTISKILRTHEFSTVSKPLSNICEKELVPSYLGLRNLNIPDQDEE